MPAPALLLPALLSSLGGATSAGIGAIASDKKSQAEKDLANVHTTTPGVTDFGQDMTPSPEDQRNLTFMNKRRPIIFGNNTY